MSLTIELSPRVRQALKRYCATRRLTQTQAVMQALELLLVRDTEAPTAYELGEKGFGTDLSGPRDVARRTKLLLRERLSGKALRSR